MRKLIIMRGLPGSGKSYTAKRLAKDKGTVVSADDYFMVNGKYVFNRDETYIAHAQCQAKTARLMAGGAPLIVIDNTNVKVMHYQVYLELAREFEYEEEIVFPEYKLAFKKPKVWDVDYLAYNNKHDVPLEVIQQMADDFEW